MPLHPASRRALAILLPLACVAAPRAAAQDAPPTLRPADVPMRGTRAQDFVPAGWKIASQVQGDLNGDGRADRVLHLVPRDAEYDPGGVGIAPEAGALVIVLAGSGGGLRRAGVSTGLLQPLVPQWGLHLAIRRGVLVVNQNYGMTDVVDATHRFRLDVGSGRFILIGRDLFDYHRPQGMYDTVKTSENYLTGVRLVTTGHWAGERYWESTERQAIPRTRTTFEDAAESEPD